MGRLVPSDEKLGLVTLDPNWDYSLTKIAGSMGRFEKSSSEFRNGNLPCGLCLKAGHKFSDLFRGFTPEADKMKRDTLEGRT